MEYCAFYSDAALITLCFLNYGLHSVALACVQTHPLTVFHLHSYLFHSTKRKQKSANPSTAQKETKLRTSMADQK